MTMRKRNPTPRHEQDFYRTPWDCTRALLRREPVAGDVWECACGDGKISRELVLAGANVRSTDLIDRGYGESGVDFLAQREPFAGTIFTNPPYKLASQFALHALAVGASKVVLLLRLSWLEGRRRKRAVFDRTPPSRVWVCSKRPTLWHGDDPAARDEGGAISYAWFVWDAQAEGPCIVDWLDEAKGLDVQLRAHEDRVERLTNSVTAYTYALRLAAEAADL